MSLQDCQNGSHQFACALSLVVRTMVFGRGNFDVLTATKRSRGFQENSLAVEIWKRAKEKETKRKSNGNATSQNSVESKDTQKEIATIANTSHDTVHKVKAIKNKADAKTLEKVRDGSDEKTAISIFHLQNNLRLGLMLMSTQQDESSNGFSYQIRIRVPESVRCSRLRPRPACNSLLCRQVFGTRILFLRFGVLES